MPNNVEKTHEALRIAPRSTKALAMPNIVEAPHEAL
jgi:hypothetical protein